ncbi:MAG: ThuA domain-containing protein [Planctomycetes bacterium]|nr:ThuA domain-containing protein [Planctomycetota bacterium]
MRMFLSCVLVGVLAATAAAGDKKIRVVLIDGQNNHNWKATTPIMKQALLDNGRFSVDVATSPQMPTLAKPAKPKDSKDEKAAAKYKEDLAKYEAALPKFNEQLKLAQAALTTWKIDFDNYDVIVSNYNGQPWPKHINTALDERLKGGKIALVIVHAANNSFGGWDDYRKMVGMGWYGANTGDRLFLDDNGKKVIVPKGKGDGPGHRYTGKFSVNIRDDQHPITKGMPLEWLHNNDELYDNMRGPIENVHLLATAHAPAGKGTGVHEPMIWTVTYGKGRVFHTPMGHDVNAMLCVGFQTTLLRGTEWAVTGNVTIPIPANFPTEKNTSVVPKAK